MKHIITYNPVPNWYEWKMNFEGNFIEYKWVGVVSMDGMGWRIKRGGLHGAWFVHIGHNTYSLLLPFENKGLHFSWQIKS